MSKGLLRVIVSLLATLGLCLTCAAVSLVPAAAAPPMAISTFDGHHDADVVRAKSAERGAPGWSHDQSTPVDCRSHEPLASLDSVARQTTTSLKQCYRASAPRAYCAGHGYDKGAERGGRSRPQPDQTRACCRAGR